MVCGDHNPDVVEGPADFAGARGGAHVCCVDFAYVRNGMLPIKSVRIAFVKFVGPQFARDAISSMSSPPCSRTIPWMTRATRVKPVFVQGFGANLRLYQKRLDAGSEVVDEDWASAGFGTR
mmetsp:Transcript_31060/g.89788  ORF Transcript_31060/g.89788 Transcript_31060/m.89788 type:complete len:121 (+) Transcript_31060:363-725(+)